MRVIAFFKLIVTTIAISIAIMGAILVAVVLAGIEGVRFVARIPQMIKFKTWPFHR